MTLPRMRRRLATLGMATVGVTVAVAMAAPPALAQEPSGTIRNAGGDTAVADSYIVVFKDSSVTRAGVDKAARDLAAKHDGAVARTYRAALRGFEVKATAARAARIAADPSVAYVEQNHTVHIQDTQNNPRAGPGPDRPAQPAAQQLVHVPVDRADGARVHHRHRHLVQPQRLRRPRDQRLRRDRRRCGG
ncbi:protease inhibitor I9 family protein [Phytohabitans houttuyneae]|uniref:Inhibitor I9 domain-containing protein n=1 Tax=Phytohabitans houttuyneae TaxID=1076126 RepID=A0A6V8KCK3_9ACTN|nr:hypothetical protein Phou_040190 [Phytohabitans houttuyneae]